jgi:hypothetical protein
MLNTRPRRIIRRAVIAVAGTMLLLSGYVTAWLVSRAYGAGLLSSPAGAVIGPAFAPIKRYCDAELPGGIFLRDLWWTVSPIPRHALHDPFVKAARPRPEMIAQHRGGTEFPQTKRFHNREGEAPA